MIIFPSLPYEISGIIDYFVKENAANTIIKNWYNYLNNKIIATKLFIKFCSGHYNDPKSVHRGYDAIYNFARPNIDCFNYKNSLVLDYCSKIISGREDKYWWYNKLRYISKQLIADSVYLNLDKTTEKQKNIYNRISNSYYIIKNKFNGKFVITKNLTFLI
tara:strand:- start:411 stop:893 length:483 start_codon:yes stop_codon:yes gene_type:complete